MTDPNLPKSRPWVLPIVLVGVGAAIVGGIYGGTAIANTANQAPTVQVAADPSDVPTETPNAVPVAVIAPPSVSHLEVNFDGDASSDDGLIQSWVWDFGDGTNENGIVLSHVYKKAGKYTVTLTVTDELGLTGTATVDVTAKAPPPPPQQIQSGGDSNDSGPIKCPAGSSANSADGPNDTSCLPNVCFHIPIPDPAHPECDKAVKP